MLLGGIILSHWTSIKIGKKNLLHVLVFLPSIKRAAASVDVHRTVPNSTIISYITGMVSADRNAGKKRKCHTDTFVGYSTKYNKHKYVKKIFPFSFQVSQYKQKVN